jgi:predicted ATPase
VRLKSIKLVNFRRFKDLEIQDLPSSARLVVLAGPNGSGKSSLFDALLLKHRVDSGVGWNNDKKYYDRSIEPSSDLFGRVAIVRHDGAENLPKGSVYVRTAYRNDHEFISHSLTRQGEVDTPNLSRLIEPDATVASNYQRLAAQAMEDVFVNENESTTIGFYREKIIGEVREPLSRLFPSLTFIGIGNPLDQGSFKFNKGTTKGFDYKNLSGGEKASFDLILDFVVKRRTYVDAIYCIDEPETHMNTKLQGALLGELLQLLPADSQLWIASHSIGMMRKAREVYETDPSSVVFLDFGGSDFDESVTLKPSKPTRAFWNNVMHVALDDLAYLVAPRQVVICEGNPTKQVVSKNAEFDAKIYSTIFADEKPDVTFVSGGNSKEIVSDFLGLAALLSKIASGITVTRVIDRDDHAPADVDDYQTQGIRVLSRRHIESFLYDDEVLTALCHSVEKGAELTRLLKTKESAITESVARGNPPDDIKSAAGTIYSETKRILGLTQVGNDQAAFARQALAPLIKPGMAVYADLKRDIFAA